MQVQSLGREDSLQKEMATHSGILAWEIPQRSPMGYSLWGRKESDATYRRNDSNKKLHELSYY